MQVKVAVVQSRPKLFELEETLADMERNVEQLSAEGCRLILFPESVLPGYPRGFDFGAVVGKRTKAGRELWLRYWESSIDVPGPTTDRIAQWAKKGGVYLAIGVTERDQSNGSLYCSLLYFSPQEGYVGKHRKLKPTASERLIWAEGQGDSLLTYDSPIGRFGGLICWENYMPLARFALYDQGLDIYLAPTADARAVWPSSMQHIALESRCFVLSCNQFALKSDYPDDLVDLLPDEPEILCRGGSLICSPLGEIITGPLWDTEGVLMANIDLDDIIRARFDFSPAGHYHRPDVFELTVNGQPNQLRIE